MEENIQTVWVSVRPWRTMRSLRERPIFGRDWVARTMNQTRIQGVLPGKIAMEKNLQTVWASARRGASYAPDAKDHFSDAI